MAKKNNQMIIASIVIVILLASGLAYIFKEQLGFAAFTPSGQYFVPLYTTVICDKLPELTIDTWDLSDYSEGSFGTRKDIYCQSTELAGHYPQGCDFEVSNTDGKIGVDVGVCDINTRTCTKTEDLNGVETTQKHVDQYDGLTVQYSGANFLLDEGNVIITTRSQAFGLWQYVGTGRVDILGTCDLDLYTKYQGTFPDTVTDIQSNNVLRVGNPVPIIIGQVNIQSPRMIVNKDGEAVYIEGPGGYYPTFEEDGKIYVDVRRTSFVEDDSIVCSPASPYCNDDGTKYIPSPEGKFCDKYVGIGNSYIQKDSTESCKMDCNEATQSLEFTDDCIQIGENCPAERPFFDANTQTCIATGGNGGTVEEPSLLPWLLGIVVVIIIIILVIAIARKNQRGGF